MELPPEMVQDWARDHALGRAWVSWLHDHPDAGDADPISSGVAALRLAAPTGSAPCG